MNNPTAGLFVVAFLMVAAKSEGFTNTEVGKNMFFSKTKMFLAAGLLLAMVLTDTASAAFDGRFFKPYQPGQFGGSRRSPDGIYGAVEMLYWRLDPPKYLDQMNVSMNVSETPADFRFGTRITFGNRSKHYGWRFTGTGVSGLGGTIQQTASWNWNDSGEFIHPVTGDPTPLLWMNLTNDYREFSSRTNLLDLDLSGTYRTHPLKWGELEFFAGAKYRDVDDKLSFTTVSNYDPNGENATMYAYRFLDETLVFEAMPRWLLEDVVAIENPDWLSLAQAWQQLWEDWLNFLQDFDGQSLPPLGMDIGIDRIWQARNRMVGPNLGFNVSRRNSRWTFGTGASVFLGVNNQSYTFYESGVADFVTTDPSSLTFGDLNALKILQGTLVPGTTYIKQRRTVFSPGVNLQVSAKWQWTDAIGVCVGFDSTIMSNVARGSHMELVADPGGGYAIRLKSKGDVVTLYGISLGLDIRR